MTFEEALKFKNSLNPDEVDDDDYEFDLFVVPETIEYYLSYKDFVAENIRDLTDEHSQLFARDGHFAVRGICDADPHIMYSPVINKSND